MKCEDCLHYEVCDQSSRMMWVAMSGKTECDDFKDRSSYVVREKGEWEVRVDDYDNEYMLCPVCREEFYDGDNDTVDRTPNFCPNCGADMRKENDNGVD